MREMAAKGGFARIAPWLGLAAIAAYWYWVHPPDFGRLGYVEDIGGLETVRQQMAENLQRFGRPVFRTDQFMAPFGASNPFMSWSIERDWIGAYFWMLSPDFPFFWAYFGASLALTYLGVAFFLGRMGLGAAPRWMFSALVVLLHVPRHFKVWHHFEHLPQHWLYLSLFFDAWIWQRAIRERRWSWTLEIWRGLVVLGVFMSTGYFWGPMLMLWIIVRAGILVALLWSRRAGGQPIAIEGHWRAAIAPAVLCLALLGAEVVWFSALFAEVKGIESIFQPLGWFAHGMKALEPLWFGKILGPLYDAFPHWQRPSPIDSPETVVTVGWFLWMPLITALLALRRKAGGAGLRAVAPILIFFLLCWSFIREGFPYYHQTLIRDYFPFMSYFRVASRMGLFFPETMGAIIALAWPELAAWFRAWWGRSRGFRVAVGVFAALSVIEASWLLHPVNVMPKMPNELRELLTRVRETPGTMVLDLPFCVAGGNGACTYEQCPNYPFSTAGIAFRAWHGKNVHGLYQARMLSSHCQIYNRAPYVNWFQAWREQRCFTDAEWTGFCDYLDRFPEMSAVLVYPDIWVGARDGACMAKFVERLGPVKGSAQFFSQPTRGGAGANPTRVFQFGGKCVSRP